MPNPPPPFPPLPALRSLGELAEAQPCLVIDTREQTPLRFARLFAVRDGLQTGDYSVRGCEDTFAVERKSIPDLVGSVTGERERFFRELRRMGGHEFRRLLVVGSRDDIVAGRYRSSAKPASILASLATIEVRFDVLVVFASAPEEAAALVEDWAWWHAREVVARANELTRAARALRVLTAAEVAEQAKLTGRAKA